MEIVRRIAAVLIAVSLVLPQRSCVNDGKVQIEYPLTNAGSALSIAFILAFFLLPLLLLLLARYPIASRLAGVLVTGAGLYYIAYASTILATRMLVGWYAYTVGASAYLAITLVQLLRAWKPGGSPPGDHSS